MGIHSLTYQFGLMPSVAWSISTEWFFYLTFPVIALSLTISNKINMKLIILSVLCITMPIIIFLICTNQLSINLFAIHHFGGIADSSNSQDSFYRWLIYFSPYSRVSEFIVGCLTASIYMRLSNTKPSIREENIGFSVLICAIISILILHHFIFNSSHIRGMTWLIALHQCFGFAPSFAIVIFCNARYQNAITRFLSKPTILLGGEISYSMYLLHLPIAEAFSRDAAPVTSFNVALADCSRLVIAAAAIFGAALVSYTIIEVPARQLIRKSFAIGNRKHTPNLELI
jgi:peptidoglycan/LPS O-acetylase OafA/YrhL